MRGNNTLHQLSDARQFPVHECVMDVDNMVHQFSKRRSLPVTRSSGRLLGLRNSRAHPGIPANIRRFA